MFVVDDDSTSGGMLWGRVLHNATADKKKLLINCIFE